MVELGSVTANAHSTPQTVLQLLKILFKILHLAKKVTALFVKS